MVQAMRSSQPLEQRGQPPALALRQIGKTYPGVIALDDVDLTLHRGEIHAVLGENGAGKSTLIKIITGVIEKDSGQILANGAAVEIGSPQNARKLGISAVPQDILLVPAFSVGRNILLGMEGSRFLRREALDRKQSELVNAALAQVGAGFTAEAPTASLSVPQRRLAQIARALVESGEILVLDEPTAVLSEPDAQHLIERLLAFREQGKAIVYITHRLSEVMQMADRVTVLRDGRRVGEFVRGDFDRARILNLMAKTNSANAGPRQSSSSHLTPTTDKNSEALRVTDLTSRGRFESISLSAKRGEIVGIAGVQGSGHGALLHAIAGAATYESGDVRIFGAPIRSGSIADAFGAGSILVPADRRGAGIVASLSSQDNVVLSPRIDRACRPFGFRSSKHERSVTKVQIETLRISPPSPRTLTGNLSGGNQQKVALARALSAGVKLLLVEEPTQGIDVNSRAEIHVLLTRMATEENCAVVVASSEFEELIGLADVIHVMRLGRLSASLVGSGASYQDILHHALP
jgi:ABC-type sugar transport system ATPase subunit